MANVVQPLVVHVFFFWTQNWYDQCILHPVSPKDNLFHIHSIVSYQNQETDVSTILLIKTCLDFTSFYITFFSFGE